MREPVVSGTPNNFQQKMRMGQSFGAMWGREQFVVRSKVRRSDGLLLEAKMDNELALRIKVGCDQQLDQCRHSAPLRLRREVALALIERGVDNPSYPRPPGLLTPPQRPG